MSPRDWNCSAPQKNEERLAGQLTGAETAEPIARRGGACFSLPSPHDLSGLLHKVNERGPGRPRGLDGLVVPNRRPARCRTSSGVIPVAMNSCVRISMWNRSNRGLAHATSVCGTGAPVCWFSPVPASVVLVFITWPVQVNGPSRLLLLKGDEMGCRRMLSRLNQTSSRASCASIWTMAGGAVNGQGYNSR